MYKKKNFQNESEKQMIYFSNLNSQRKGKENKKNFTYIKYKETGDKITQMWSLKNFNVNHFLVGIRRKCNEQLQLQNDKLIAANINYCILQVDYLPSSLSPPRCLSQNCKANEICEV